MGKHTKRVLTSTILAQKKAFLSSGNTLFWELIFDISL
jgi:hypothetical protein